MRCADHAESILAARSGRGYPLRTPVVPQSRTRPIIVAFDGTISGVRGLDTHGRTAQSAVVIGAVRCNARAALLLCGAIGESALAAECDGSMMMMKEGFYQIESESTGLVGLASLASGHFSGEPEGMTASHFRAAIGWLPLVVIVAAGAWLLMTDHARKRADSQPIRLARHLATAVAVLAPPHVTVGLAKDPPFDPATAEAITPEQPAPVDGLKISSQSWRRGGLGANAFVTMTLRNTNDYAVRDIEISCAFARPDGSHLTDRTRLIHDMVNSKSRKTFTHLHVGFVNVNVSKAKCSLLAASHV